MEIPAVTSHVNQRGGVTADHWLLFNPCLLQQSETITNSFSQLKGCKTNGTHPSLVTKDMLDGPQCQSSTGALMAKTIKWYYEEKVCKCAAQRQVMNQAEGKRKDAAVNNQTNKRHVSLHICRVNRSAGLIRVAAHFAWFVKSDEIPVRRNWEIFPVNSAAHSGDVPCYNDAALAIGNEEMKGEGQVLRNICASKFGGMKWRRLQQLKETSRQQKNTMKSPSENVHSRTQDFFYYLLHRLFLRYVRASFGLMVGLIRPSENCAVRPVKDVTRKEPGETIRASIDVH
ncbi:uncharacterized protein V6R79_010706 [Siganus canaliculatus]